MFFCFDWFSFTFNVKGTRSIVVIEKVIRGSLRYNIGALAEANEAQDLHAATVKKLGN